MYLFYKWHHIFTDTKLIFANVSIGKHNTRSVYHIYILMVHAHTYLCHEENEAPLHHRHVWTGLTGTWQKMQVAR